MNESSAMQDATALLTVAVDGRSSDELDAVVREILAAQPAEELVVALVSLARSMCFVTARMAHAVDELLSNEETFALSDDDVLPAAMEVVRLYARRVANLHAETGGD